MPPPLRKVRAFTLGFATAAFVMMALAGPGTRLEWWSWQTGFAMFRAAAYVGIAVAVVAIVLVLMLAVPRWRARPWLPILALCLALAAVAPPVILLAQARSVPPIHDITTDTADPPGFAALLDTRNKSPNGSAYGGAEVAQAQQKAYADIKPLVVARPPREAMQRAIDAARDMGWEIVASDAAAGRIEATDTTPWFGFKDDIVVRVRPEGAGSRIDVRSASRVGQSDVGANAARIRGYLDKLK
jgi:uncharacterized protein (DUF1499 family)/heme exporter protein D